MTVEVHGTPNWQRFAETWCALIAAREGLEIVPGSVKVTLKSGEPSGGLAQLGVALQGHGIAPHRDGLATQ